MSAMREIKNKLLLKPNRWLVNFRVSLRRNKFLVVLACLGIAAAAILLFLPSRQTQNLPPSTPEKERIQLQNESRRTWAQILAGGFFFVTAYLTWCNLKETDEANITERFTRAIDQLASDKTLMVRLGSIHALLRIAKDSEDDRVAVMSILSEYIREHSQWNDAKESTSKPDVQAALAIFSTKAISQLNDDYKGPDFSKLDLRNLDFSKLNLKRANFTSAHLEYSRFNEAVLEKANFKDAHLENAWLIGANLFMAHLRAANLYQAKLTGADLKEAKLPNANLENATLFSAKLNGAFLESAKLENANFTKASTEGVKLKNTGYVRRDDGAIVKMGSEDDLKKGQDD